MYLLLGDPDDLVCVSVLASLERNGRGARIIANPILNPCLFGWRFDTQNSSSWIAFEDGTHLPNEEIEGVLVRNFERIAAQRWDPHDHGYAQTEMYAALFGWLWSLDCPVVNRYPPPLWFRLDLPLIFWHRLLAQCGLRGLSSLISNVEQEIDAFGKFLGDQPIYAPLTNELRYPVDSEDVWQKIARIQRVAPVHLTQGAPSLCVACVVGSRVVWNQTIPRGAEILAPSLIRFSAAAGIAFCEIGIALTATGAQVATVKAYPRLEHFHSAAQQEIISDLASLLTGDLDKVSRRPYSEE
jgi:hypothetical protein